MEAWPIKWRFLTSSVTLQTSPALHLFSRLAQELQDRVWSEAISAADPRLVELRRRKHEGDIGLILTSPTPFQAYYTLATMLASWP